MQNLASNVPESMRRYTALNVWDWRKSELAKEFQPAAIYFGKDINLRLSLQPPGIYQSPASEYLSYKE